MRTFNLTVPEPLTIGDVTYGVVDVSVADEIAWDRAMQTFRAEPTGDALMALYPIVQKCIPDFDVMTLGGRDIVRLGYLLIKGVDKAVEQGNASGAASRRTKQPSSPTTSAATPVKSSGGKRGKSASGRGAPTA